MVPLAGVSDFRAFYPRRVCASTYDGAGVASPAHTTYRKWLLVIGMERLSQSSLGSQCATSARLKFGICICSNTNWWSCSHFWVPCRKLRDSLGRWRHGGKRRQLYYRWPLLSGLAPRY